MGQMASLMPSEITSYITPSSFFITHKLAHFCFKFLLLDLSRRGSLGEGVGMRRG